MSNDSHFTLMGNYSHKLSEFLLDSYDEIFVPDGFDSFNGTVNGETCDFNSERVKSFKKSKLTRWSTFLGFANRELKPGEPQSFWNLFDNFFGIKSEYSDWRNVLRIFLITPINVLSTPFKLFRNVLKIFTEFLPLIGVKLSKQFEDKLVTNFFETIENFNEIDSKKGKSQKIFKLLFIGTLLLINRFVFLQTFETLLAIGRAITSPILAVLIAWHVPETSEASKLSLFKQETFLLAKILNKITYLKDKYRKHLNAIAVVFSIVTTMLTYSVVIPYLALGAAPLLEVQIPAIGNSINGLVGAIAPVLNSISEVLLPIAEPIVTFMINFDPYPPIAMMGEMMGLSFIGGVIVSILGTAIYKITETFRNWWWKDKDEKPVNNNYSDLKPHLLKPTSWHTITKTLFNQAVAKVAHSTKTIRPKVLNMIERTLFYCIRKEIFNKPRLLTYPSNANTSVANISNQKIKFRPNFFGFFSSTKIIDDDIAQKQEKNSLRLSGNVKHKNNG